jgi:hypothetical protein
MYSMCLSIILFLCEKTRTMASLLAVVTYSSTYCTSLFPPHTIIYTGIETVGKNVK